MKWWRDFPSAVGGAVQRVLGADEWSAAQRSIRRSFAPVPEY